MILRLALVVVLALLLPLQAAAQTPKRGGTLVVGMSQDLPGLDPHPSTSTITYQVLSLVYQGLVDFDRDLKIKPVLAELLASKKPLKPVPLRPWPKLKMFVQMHMSKLALVTAIAAVLGSAITYALTRETNLASTWAALGMQNLNDIA